MTLGDALARFHAAITGGTPLAAARDLVVRGEVDELERLHVYAHAYTARIAGVLELDYPKLARLVDVRGLTAEYLRVFPPSHPSLREVGAQVARFLGDRGMPAHLAELAALERARIEVFDSADAMPLAREDLAALEPVEFPGLRLQLVPSSRVVSMTTNADDIWDALETECEPPEPAAGPRVVLVWRREYTVVHRTLDAEEARVAQALVRGTSFGDLCEELEAAPERAIALLLRWLDARCLRR